MISPCCPDLAFHTSDTKYFNPALSSLLSEVEGSAVVLSQCPNAAHDGHAHQPTSSEKELRIDSSIAVLCNRARLQSCHKPSIQKSKKSTRQSRVQTLTSATPLISVTIGDQSDRDKEDRLREADFRGQSRISASKLLFIW